MDDTIASAHQLRRLPK